MAYPRSTRNAPSWRGWAAALTLLFALVPAGAPSAGERMETKQVRVGEVFILKFPGNREGGYRWRLNKDASHGLNNVEVKMIGWTIPNDRHRAMYFRKLPTMSISVLPKTPGQADIAFDYYRNWGNRPHSKKKIVRVVIK